MNKTTDILLIAVLLGWLLLYEKFTQIQLIGAAIVLAGTWLSQNAGRMPRQISTLVPNTSHA